MIESVKVSHHWFACEAGSPDRTVKTELSSNTHCSAQSDKSVLIRVAPISDSNSLKILRRLGCIFDQFGTENESHIAAQGVW